VQDGNGSRFICQGRWGKAELGLCKGARRGIKETARSGGFISLPVLFSFV
jgi:hypothetical protein